MAISTTGRRLLCILCSVCVLSKMLKLCGAEGSSFRFWWMLAVVCCWDPADFVSEVDLVAEAASCLCEVHQIGPFVKLLSDFWLMLSTVCGCCWSRILFLKQQLGVHLCGLLFGCCQLWCAEFASLWFIRLIDCVFTGCGVLHFNAECSEMKLVRWWACSGSNRLCLRFAVCLVHRNSVFWNGTFVAIADGCC